MCDNKGGQKALFGKVLKDSMAKKEDNLIPQAHVLTVEEQSKGGKASAEARRRRTDMRELMKLMLDDQANEEELTYAQKLTVSMLKIASTPEQGAAAVRAYETILKIIGQDSPDATRDTLDLLKKILELNKENAGIYSERETT